MSIRKDKYNKKLEKYHVEVDEESEDVDIQEEREEEHEEMDVRTQCVTQPCCPASEGKHLRGFKKSQKKLEVASEDEPGDGPGKADEAFGPAEDSFFLEPAMPASPHRRSSGSSRMSEIHC